VQFVRALLIVYPERCLSDNLGFLECDRQNSSTADMSSANKTMLETNQTKPNSGGNHLPTGKICKNKKLDILQFEFDLILKLNFRRGCWDYYWLFGKFFFSRLKFMCFQLLIVLLLIAAFILYKRIKRRQQHHGVYMPQQEEEIHGKDLPATINPPNVTPPGTDGLI
jgi:hypothetical protein